MFIYIYIYYIYREVIKSRMTGQPIKSIDYNDDGSLCNSVDYAPNESNSRTLINYRDLFDDVYSCAWC